MLDKSWKEKFNEIALAQGKERYMGNRVADLKKTETTTVQETKRDLADQVINGAGTSLSSMSKEELLELLEM